MITLENFGPFNRDKKIGNSLYRICRVHDDLGAWYIHETYNDGSTWAANNACHSDDLQTVINKLNSITKEREVVSLRFQTDFSRSSGREEVL
jgi:quinol monooxygenase YgiN